MRGLAIIAVVMVLTITLSIAGKAIEKGINSVSTKRAANITAIEKELGL